MGKFGQKPIAPVKPPQDPSAMSVLGLVPPERPQAAVHADAKPKATPTISRSTGSVSSVAQASSSAADTKVRKEHRGTLCGKANKTGGHQTQSRPPPQAPRKRAKPSLFVPKKR